MGEQPAWAAAAEAVGAGAVAWIARMFFRRARNASDSESIRLFRRELMEIKREMRDVTHRVDTLTGSVDSLALDNEESKRQVSQLARNVRSDLVDIRLQFSGANQKIGELLERLGRD